VDGRTETQLVSAGLETLAERLVAATERATAALRVAVEAPPGLDLSALEAPLDKVVAEVAILAREVACVPDEPLRDLGLVLGREVARMARASRIAVAVALRPSVALDLAVGHILLSNIGLVEADLQGVLERALRSPVAGARERLPHRALEQAWLSALAGFAPRPGGTAIAPTAMSCGIDLPGASRDDLYALTHAIAYATDFGRWPVPEGIDPAAVLELCDSSLAIVLDDDDFDLAAELVMAWPCLHAPLSPTARYAFKVLCHVEDAAGILPSLTLRRETVDRQPAELRAAYTVATAYHTALVMGLACALLLRSGLPWQPELLPASVVGRQLPGRPLRQWQEVGGAPASLVRDIALNRALRRADFAKARDVLAAGVADGVVASPLALQVAQMLARLGAVEQKLLVD
jgi:hypothetical protein